MHCILGSIVFNTTWHTKPGCNWGGRDSWFSVMKPDGYGKSVWTLKKECFVTDACDLWRGGHLDTKEYLKIKPPQKFLVRGFSTPCPVWCQKCIIRSELHGQMNLCCNTPINLYRNTCQVLVARSFLVAGLITNWVPRRVSCGNTTENNTRTWIQL